MMQFHASDWLTTESGCLNILCRLKARNLIRLQSDIRQSLRTANNSQPDSSDESSFFLRPNILSNYYAKNKIFKIKRTTNYVNSARAKKSQLPNSDNAKTTQSVGQKQKELLVCLCVCSCVLVQLCRRSNKPRD